MSKKQSCREFLSCPKVLCPAYSERDTECWLIPETHCSDSRGEDFPQKLPVCLNCPYFKETGEDHPDGWNQFLAEQLQRHNAEALNQLYQKEESFVEILNRIPDGLFTTDKELRITFFNPAAEKITGFSAYDAVGMYCKDVFKNAICETDCALRRAVAEGSDIHNREYVITNIKGKKIPIICSTSAFQDSSGRVTGGLEIFKNITELKRLQEEIVTRERKYSRIFEGSHDMIYITNQNGSILDVNQAGVEMLGYPNKEEFLNIGSAKEFYLNPEDRLKFLRLINQKGYAKDFEADFKDRNGTPIHVLISGRRYENIETGDIEYEGIIKDITRRKNTEEILKQRNWELSILNSVAVALNLTMDMDHILKVTLNNVLKVLRLKRGGIFLIDREEKIAVLQVRCGLSQEDFSNPNEIIFKDTLLMKYLLLEDAVLAPKPTFPPFQVSYRTKHGRTAPWMSCFLISFKGKGVGFFGLDIPSSQELSQHEFHLLGSLGNFLGGAIANARMLKTIARHRQELRRLTEKLFQSQEEERRRIARELHDEAGQSLTAIKLGLDRLEDKLGKNAETDGLSHPSPDIPERKELREDIRDIRKIIGRTSSEIRRLSYRLHPTLLSDLGLEPALNLYFKEISHHSGLEIDFHIVGFDHRLTPEMETVFYRFSQESLTNTLNHSGAENFRLSLIKSYPKIIFLAEDDGVGFDGQVSRNDKRSLGLLGMRERVSLLGGTFQLRSKLGEGTRIRIEIPLDEEESGK